MDTGDKNRRDRKAPGNEKQKEPTQDSAGNWEDVASSSAGPGSKMGDTIKKLLATGVSAAFMTEDSLRRIVSDLHLPKETLNLLLQGASRSKEELMNKVSREVITIISKIDFVKEASRFVEDHKFRVTAEIEVLPKSGTTSPPPSSSDVDTDPKADPKIKS